MKTPLIVSAVAALAAALVPISILAAPGDLYEVDFGVGTIYKFAQDGTKNTFATGLSFPYGLAFDGSGNLFVADYSSNTIYKFAPDGTKSIFASGLNNPSGLAFDRAGNLFEADNGSNTIFKFAPDGTKSTYASGLNKPIALAFDSAGNLFEADNGSGKIFEFTPTGIKGTFASGLNSPLGLAFDSAGNLFETDNGSNTIFKITPGGTMSTFASGLSGPFGLAFDSAGNLFEADGGSGTIFIFTPGKVPFATGLSGPISLAFEPTRHQFLNVSTRALVGTGDNVLIGGFIMNGNGQVDEAVVVRALGPSLTAFGVPGALQDPTLELRSADGALIATNDNWKTRPGGSSQQALITSTGVAPSDDHEPAIYARLPAGHYTPIVRGAGGTSGVAIVEVYNLQ
jgi:sugar lactone lactonase YvrE